jgi:GR25 family glycosyltransferase involved in LPS biosynthesis
MNEIINLLNNYKVIIEKNYNSNNSLINIPVYVINLNTDIYRRGYIKYFLNKFNINYKLIIVERIMSDKEIVKGIKNGITGCCLSHLWCIKNAIEKNHNYFLIMEDDVIFNKNFINLIKKVNYKKYDMIQLGCCDFNLKKNIKEYDINDVNNDNLFIYQPNEIALGAYGNIYNIHFAKMVLEEKLIRFSEFDTKFDMYYKKYNIGICLPNLLTTELSTTNTNHNYSFLNSLKNEHFIKKCFIKFNYHDYYFILIIFIEFCYNEYMNNNFVLNYDKIITDFSDKFNTNKLTSKKRLILDVLSNNNIYENDIISIIEIIKNDIYLIKK